MSVPREILAFEQDLEGDWVATLDCHHRRHVRHRPPLSSYAWVEDPDGRAAHVGTQIECDRCLQRVWPEGLERYSETKLFDNTSVPRGLLAEHNTRRGVWGRLELASGALALCFAAPLDARVELDGPAWAAIPPTLLHHLELDTEVRFCVSFWRPSASTGTPS